MVVGSLLTCFPYCFYQARLFIHTAVNLLVFPQMWYLLSIIASSLAFQVRSPHHFPLLTSSGLAVSRGWGWKSWPEVKTLRGKRDRNRQKHFLLLLFLLLLLLFLPVCLQMRKRRPHFILSTHHAAWLFFLSTQQLSKLVLKDAQH